MTEPIRSRIARVRPRSCAQRGCGRTATGISSLCKRHDTRRTRTGSPDGATITLRTLRPYLRDARAYIVDHLEHPAIAAGLRWCHALVYGPRPHLAARPRNPSAPERLAKWLDRLRSAGVEPVDVLSVIVAVELLRNADPRALKNDAHERHQMANRVLRLAPAPMRGHYRGGAGGRMYARVTNGEAQLLGARLQEALGLLAHRVARAITSGEAPTDAALLAGVTTSLPGEHHQPSQQGT